MKFEGQVLGVNPAEQPDCALTRPEFAPPPRAFTPSQPMRQHYPQRLAVELWRSVGRRPGDVQGDDTVARTAFGESIGRSKPLLVALILVGCLVAGIAAVRFQAPELLGKQKVLTDFDAFYIAGRLALEGRVSEAYHAVSMVAAQMEMTGTVSFMPWTYPPPFTLAMEGFATLPIGAAFLVFAAASCSFYLWVLWRIAGPWLPGVAAAVAPAIILNLSTGQNGFLIAGLIGAFLLAFRDNRRLAGLPLGLLIIKPHLAVAVGLLVLMRRRWSVVLIAGAVALALLAISTAVYGLAIWTDFRDAVGEAGRYLAAGYYPLFRMNSVYAAAHSLGAAPAAAMALQMVSAVVALGILGLACVKDVAFNRLAALACAASVCVSPYGYDYDLTVLGVGIAFIYP
ncbi:MAG: glycosyltransferase family 87 protein, partial [Phenylobacterium sp.]